MKTNFKDKVFNFNNDLIQGDYSNENLIFLHHSLIKTQILN